jgi:hypothetical protein
MLLQRCIKTRQRESSLSDAWQRSGVAYDDVDLDSALIIEGEEIFTRSLRPCPSDER